MHQRQRLLNSEGEEPLHLPHFRVWTPVRSCPHHVTRPALVQITELFCVCWDYAGLPREQSRKPITPINLIDQTLSNNIRARAHAVARRSCPPCTAETAPTGGSPGRRRPPAAEQGGRPPP